MPGPDTRLQRPFVCVCDTVCVCACEEEFLKKKPRAIRRRNRERFPVEGGKHLRTGTGVCVLGLGVRGEHFRICVRSKKKPQRYSWYRSNRTILVQWYTAMSFGTMYDTLLRIETRTPYFA